MRHSTMRGVRPIKVYNSARVLQTPPVERLHSVQPVDLNPRGATIAVDVPGQNPFEDMAGIEVVTQASGGMAQADDSMKSMAVMAPEVAPVTYSMIPGMGDHELTTQGPVPIPTASDATGTALKTPVWSQLLEVAATGYGSAQTTRQREAEAKIAAAKAEAAKYQYQGGLTTTEAMAARKGITLPLMGIAAAAIGVAIWLKVSGKNRPIGRKRKTTKRRR